MNVTFKRSIKYLVQYIVNSPDQTVSILSDDVTCFSVVNLDCNFIKTYLSDFDENTILTSVTSTFTTYENVKPRKSEISLHWSNQEGSDLNFKFCDVKTIKFEYVAYLGLYLQTKSII